MIEAAVPDLRRIPPGQNISVTGVDPGSISFHVYDTVRKRLTSHHFVIREERVSSYPVEVRYVWHSELDLMARIAGLSLRQRWGGWRREPFTGLSRSHVLFYGKP